MIPLLIMDSFNLYLVQQLCKDSLKAFIYAYAISILWFYTCFFLRKKKAFYLYGDIKDPHTLQILIHLCLKQWIVIVLIPSNSLYLIYTISRLYSVEHRAYCMFYFEVLTHFMKWFFSGQCKGVQKLFLFAKINRLDRLQNI